jgi:23S rRNA G2445 N2-methylase RlmL
MSQEKNQPITPQAMSHWVANTWTSIQDQAWERTKTKLQDPKVMAVLQRMKDK